jgi:hypothetical protein
MIEIIKKRMATKPYKLNKVLMFTSSGRSAEVLNCGGLYAKKQKIHPRTGNHELLLGYEA